jgi:glucose-6-phosphate 1-dehydrogenase
VHAGLTEEHALTELDLTYKSRFAADGKAPRIPGAYERLILDVIKGTYAT